MSNLEARRPEIISTLAWLKPFSHLIKLKTKQRTIRRIANRYAQIQHSQLNVVTQILFFAATALMIIDAVGYSLDAIAPIQQALKPVDPYWKRRLTLNLLLAN